MKIVFISVMEDFPWGGSEELWFRAAKEAIKRGYQVCSVTKRWDRTPDKIAQLQALKIEILFFSNISRSLKNRVLNNMGFTQNDYTLPKLQADYYVISQGGTFDFANRDQFIDLINISGKPYVIISHHNSETGNVIDDNKREKVIRFIENAEKFYFVSRRNLRSAERQIASKITNAALIGCPTNLKDVGIRRYNESPKLLMACVARLDCDFKGQDILLQILGEEKWNNRDFELKLYGSGKHASFIKMLINLYRLDGKVFLIGQVNNIHEIWSENQILVLPSISEGTPLVIKEAMLCGRTALATDVGDSGIYVIDKKTGFLAASPSYNNLSNALEVMWENKHKLKTLGEEAFKHALEITDLHPEQTLIDLIKE